MDLFAPLLKLFGPLHGIGGTGGPLQNALASGLGNALLGRTVTGPPQAGGNIGFVPELTSQMGSGFVGNGGSSGSGEQAMLGQLVNVAAKTISNSSGFVETILSMFDSNHDGLLTKGEAKKAASKFDIGSRELKDIMKGLSVEGKNEEVALSPLSEQIKRLCVEKFNFGGKAQMPSVINNNRIAAFRLFFTHMDKDNSGTLSMNEVMEVVQAFNMPVSMNIATEIFDSVDKNKDGEIDLKEFMAFMASVKDCA
nr:calcium dependent protein kinase [Hymenolepis microstoma]